MQSRHVAMSLPFAIAFVHVPPSKLGHEPGQPIIPGEIPTASHLPLILSVIFVRAAGIFPAVSQPAMLLPPGALATLPAFVGASLHFWTILVTVFSYFVNSLLMVWRHLKSAS